MKTPHELLNPNPDIFTDDESDEGEHNNNDNCVPPHLEKPMGSPFPFLTGVEEDIVKIIHSVFLADNKLLQPISKEHMLTSVWSSYPAASSGFIQWKLEIQRDPPHEILSDLESDTRNVVLRCLSKRDLATAIRLIEDEETQGKLRSWYYRKNDMDNLFQPYEAARNMLIEKQAEQTYVAAHEDYPRKRPRVHEGENTPEPLHQARRRETANSIKKCRDQKPTVPKSNPVSPTRKTQPPPPIRSSSRATVIKGDYNGDDDHTMNILLLGETGVGKSTFINGLVNYLQYGSLMQAISDKPMILINSSFIISNKSKPVTITAHSNVKLNEENEALGTVGKSSTQDPVSYLFSWMEGGNRKQLRIIDTPGINDTRGDDQDNVNMHKIFNHISQYRCLNAVFVLLKPNESKITQSFRNCIDTLLLHLHKNVTRNLFFCFTNTRSTNYRPGETLTALKEHLKQLEQRTGVQIRPHKSNMFCFDNECFRYICLVQYNKKFLNDSDIRSFDRSWKNNVAEIQRMFKIMQGIEVHHVEDTVSINRIRRTIEVLARPLAEIARNNIMNMKTMERNVDQIESLKLKGKIVQKNIYQNMEVMQPVRLEKPRTVCTSRRCIDYIHTEDGRMHPNFKTICHNDCKLKDVQEGVAYHENLRHCAVFEQSGGYSCYNCGCDWTKHMHINYELERRTASVIDKRMERRLAECRDERKQAEIMLEENKKKLRELKDEHDYISSCSAEFTAFLKYNSIIKSDPYLDYLKILIEEEKQKMEYGGNSLLSSELNFLRESYQRSVTNVLEEVKDGRRNILTSAEMETIMQRLRKLKNNGNLLKDLDKINVLDAEISPATTEVQLNINATAEIVAASLENLQITEK